MVEITVKAADSAMAMEEIQKRLGEDALIISTRKKDGKIEITATNEEPDPNIPKDKPLVLDANFRKETFNNILEDQIFKNNPNFDEHSKLNKKNTADEIVQKIIKDLEKLNTVFHDSMVVKENVYSLYARLRSIGFSKESIQKLGGDLSSVNENDVAKRLSKKFVNGKCSHFDNTDVYIISGASKSGKSTLTRKLKLAIEKMYERKELLICTDENSRKLNSSLRDLSVNKKKDNPDVQKSIILDPQSNLNDIEDLVSKIEKIDNNFKVSVIYAQPVGSSYERLRKELQFNSDYKQYLAFTKLDLFDVSIPEISAVIESKVKCMLLSGIAKVEEGLYFSKLAQIESYILNKLEEEKL